MKVCKNQNLLKNQKNRILAECQSEEPEYTKSIGTNKIWCKMTPTSLAEKEKEQEQHKEEMWSATETAGKFQKNHALYTTRNVRWTTKTWTHRVITSHQNSINATIHQLKKKILKQRSTKKSYKSNTSKVRPTRFILCKKIAEWTKIVKDEIEHRATADPIEHRDRGTVYI